MPASVLVLSLPIPRECTEIWETQGHAFSSDDPEEAIHVKKKDSKTGRRRKGMSPHDKRNMRCAHGMGLVPANFVISPFSNLPF
ncbi:hypothetical protein ACE6H2_012533 [Prunus campanulata]